VPELDAFAAVAADCSIPREYPEELLAGMEMDCTRSSFATLDDLLLYCHRVAGVVGLMMCHVMGVTDPSARRNAAHLGIAMQLTNICRDVLEDWQLGRLYLPGDLLAECGAVDLAARLGGPFPLEQKEAVARAVARILQLADGFYRSGDRGLAALSWRCALAVRAARSIYSSIGRHISRRHCDVTRGRAYVSMPSKLTLVGVAALRATAELPVRALRSGDAVPLANAPVLRFPTDLVPFPS
jgi:phytoene synthase